jgi:hypothetical protein
MDEVLRVVRRYMRLEICAVDKVNFHSAPEDHKFNSVDVVMRDRAKKDGKYPVRKQLPVLQNFLGGHCGGYNWNPRRGDLVWVFFYGGRQGIVLANAWSWAEYPACRPSEYDIAGKGGQWLEPFQDPCGDFPRQPYPPLEKPYCFPRWFHGPVTGKTGKGRDWMLLFDYCHEGHARKDCSTCKTIDSVNRADNHGFKFYSSETESEKAHPDRGIYFTPGGSYWMFESKCCEDCEECTETTCCSELFTEGKGFWTIQGAVDGQTFKGHIRHNPLGTVDIHSATEPAKIADESTGTRVVVVSPEDTSVDYAVQAKDFVTSALREILKNGKIFDSSPSEIHLTSPDIVLDGDVLITGSCTHNACSCEHTTAGSDCDIAVTISEDTIKVFDKDGNVVEEGVLGVDDTTCLQAGIDACPQNGKMFICPGTFTLEANTLFYLNGSAPEYADNPFYVALGVFDGKNIELCGSGVGSTILKMAAGQHYSGHHAVMIMNRAHWWGDGATMFVVSDMTIDGNRDEQAEWYYDGPGLILTGSLASNFRFQRLWLKDSFGYGIYCGNNGSGPINGLVINDIRATNCYKTAIMTDTVCGLLINNCIIEDSDSGLQCVGNQPDYLTRPRDAIVISDVICRRAGITLWTVNDVTMNGCYMDCTGAPLQYGLLLHSCIRVNISGSRFVNNTNYKYSTFIDANTYMEDGPCEVFLNNCDFEGSYAFRILGEAVCNVHNGRIQGYRTCIYMIGEYMSPVACKLNLHGVDVLALQPIGEDPEPTLLVDIAEGGDVQFDLCTAPKAGYFQVAAGGRYFARDCIGAGLEGHNSRWRKEEGTFNPIPASTSTITTLIDRTGAISIGTPIRYVISSVAYYGLVMNITTTTLTIAGPPLSDDIDELYFGVSEMVGQVDYVIPGAFGAAAEDELIKTIQKSHSVWRGKPAYLVQIGHIVQALDTSAQPKVTASINSSVVGTDNTNTGLAVALVVQSTGIGINPSNYRIEYGDVIELATTAGGTGDASDLTVFLTFVSES